MFSLSSIVLNIAAIVFTVIACLNLAKSFKKEPIFDAIGQFTVVNEKYPKGGALGRYSEDAYRHWGIK